MNKTTKPTKSVQPTAKPKASRSKVLCACNCCEAKSVKCKCGCICCG